MHEIHVLRASFANLTSTVVTNESFMKKMYRIGRVQYYIVELQASQQTWEDNKDLFTVRYNCLVTALSP